MEERKIKHILLYLACEHMMIGVVQLQKRIGSDNPRDNDAQGLDNPLKELYM
jgi:hypothetical protein